MDSESELGTPASNLAELFRKEAVRYQAARLQGEVMLKIRSPWLLLGIAASLLLLVVVVVAAFGTYTRKELVAGRLVVAQGAFHLRSDRRGIVEQVFVKDGQTVQLGQTLFSIRTLSGPSIQEEMDGIVSSALVGCANNGEHPNAEVCLITSPGKMNVGIVSVSQGQLVTAGLPMAELMPVDAPLAAELSVPSRAIGFVRQGLPVALHFDAFPYRKYGAGHGQITSVSFAPIPEDGMPAAGRMISANYRVLTTVDRDYVEAYGKRIPLRPGMSFEADITIDHRTLLEWVLEPLYAAGRRR